MAANTGKTFNEKNSVSNESLKPGYMDGFWRVSGYQD
jgi:hypothetical protein